MKKIIYSVLFLFICIATQAQYASQNISLYSTWDDTSVPAESIYGIRYNSVWGYAQGGKEYAIIGSTTGTYFIDVTDPVNPIKLDFVAGKRSSCIWREYKTSGKYLYAVSDDQKPNSLQIIDMSYLPDSVHVVYDSKNIFERAHTIFVDGHYLYAGSVTTSNSNYYSMAVYDITNPVLPVFIRNLHDDDPSFSTVHDMYVRNDTVYASCGYDALHIYAFNGATFTSIGDITSYPDKGYNHSSALTANGKTLVFADEVPDGLAVKVMDVSDMNNIQLKSSFHSNAGATAHNPYVKGNDKLIIAYYQDGLQIYDISNPAAPTRLGYFDTYPQNGSTYTSPAYAGCWGAYIDLPSGTILASDMQNGLFVLDAHNILTSVSDKDKNKNEMTSYLYQDELNGEFILGIHSVRDEKIKWNVVDITGRIMYSSSNNLYAGMNQISIGTSEMPGGVYLVNIENRQYNRVHKFIK